MKTNITLKLDSELLRNARIIATEEGWSISGFLASKLEEIVSHRRGCARTKKRALARLPKGFEIGFVRRLPVTSFINDKAFTSPAAFLPICK
jgi:hypothetical protein